MIETLHGRSMGRPRADAHAVLRAACLAGRAPHGARAAVAVEGPGTPSGRPPYSRRTR